MRLTWMGTASLILEQDGTGLAFDSFMGLPVRDKRNENLFRAADAALAARK